MSELANRTFTQADKLKIQQTIKEGVKAKQQAKDITDSSKDYIKAVANDLDISVKTFNTTIAAKFKEDINDRKETLDDVEELLEIAKL